jgi:tetratricopeptide (TPR) repeat protein
LNQKPEFVYQRIPGYKWVWGIIIGLIAMSYYPLSGMIVFLIGVIMSVKVLNSPANKSARLFNKGLHIYKKGFIDMAIQIWEEALNKNPDNIYALQSLSILYDEYEKKPDLALEHGKKVLALDTANTRVGYKVGQILFRMGQYNEAISVLQSLSSEGEMEEERSKLLKRCLTEKKRT